MATSTQARPPVLAEPVQLGRVRLDAARSRVRELEGSDNYPARPRVLLADPMRVLVACEFSGVVRDAFRARGHDAISCDVLETEVPGPHHRGDVREILRGRWDLVIAHPPCTYLCRAGQRWLNAADDDRPGKLKGQPRAVATLEAVAFFQLFQELDVPRVAIENPRPGSHVADLIGKPDQVVQPWEFGHGERKATGLWLKNLPPLVATEQAAGREARVHRMPPGPNRARERSRTFPGIAAAMADQWGTL